MACRRLPMVAVTKPYLFESETGPRSLADLFARRRQLIVYHFMLDPTPYGRQEPWEDSPPGWPKGDLRWLRHHDRYETAQPQAVPDCCKD